MEQLIDKNITLFYDTFGNPTGRPLLLIMGIGSQMIAWPDPFCRELAEKGHWVIRFDNRDVGLSTKIDWAEMPSFKAAEAAYNEDRPVIAPYTLSDMARDGIGLLKALNVDQAHICGLSLGGMIAQTMAIEYPDRVKSLISMQSSPSDKTLPPPAPEALDFLMTVPPSEREAYGRHMGQAFRAFSGGSPFYDEAMEIEIAEQSFDRCFYPPGFGRQYLARLASGSRKTALGSVKAPSLVIHGSHDTLLPPEHGRATAEALPGARWLLVEGLGHGLSYPKLWPLLIEAITEHTQQIRSKKLVYDFLA
jgi:pimeloyl-ACP methyl ester carboxylesterase